MKGKGSKMTYCVGSDIAAFKKGESLDLAAIPEPGEVGAACPEKCISEGSPYEIDQSHCLRCGICYEACPVQAIVKR